MNVEGGQDDGPSLDYAIDVGERYSKATVAAAGVFLNAL